MLKNVSLCKKMIFGQLLTSLLLIIVFIFGFRLLAPESASLSMTFIATIICTAALFSIAIGFFTSRHLCTPLSESVTLSKALAAGDFTRQVKTTLTDEIGQLIASLNEISHSMQNMFLDIRGGSESLYFSTESMLQISRSMTEKSDFTRDKASMVATAAEEMSANMNSVAAAVEQASVNMNIISTAIEELTSTVHEIAQNTEKAQSITTSAVTKAETTSTNVNRLGEAANEISKVTQVITDISDQTNLLALNATIEAARAGEAGKGFAVVANEIKELAKQTADATQEIRNKIEGIQSTTDITVKEIVDITSVISEIDETVSGIASAVEEQAVTTQEISSNIVQASEGIQEINENVAQSTTVVSEIAADINEVSMNAVHSAEDGVEVQYSIEEMYDLAIRLQKRVNECNVGDTKFDIVKIKQAHMVFKDNLRKVMKGVLQMTPEEVATEQTCMFGQWFYSAEGKQYEHLQSYKNVEKSHTEVHTIGKQIVSAVNNGDHDKTRDMLVRFDKARITMFHHLEDLYSA